MDIFLPVLIIAGLVNIAVGLWFIRRLSRHLPDALQAKVKVVDEQVEEGDNGKVFRPTYQVVDGPHMGLRHTSASAISPPVDRVGDIVNGLVSPETGVVTSISFHKRERLFGHLFLAMGTGAMLIGLAGLFL